MILNMLFLYVFRSGVDSKFVNLLLKQIYVSNDGTIRGSDNNTFSFQSVEFDIFCRKIPFIMKALRDRWKNNHLRHGQNMVKCSFCQAVKSTGGTNGPYFYHEIQLFKPKKGLIMPSCDPYDSSVPNTTTNSDGDNNNNNDKKKMMNNAFEDALYTPAEIHQLLWDGVERYMRGGCIGGMCVLLKGRCLLNRPDEVEKQSFTKPDMAASAPNEKISSVDPKPCITSAASKMTVAGPAELAPVMEYARGKLMEVPALANQEREEEEEEEKEEEEKVVVVSSKFPTSKFSPNTPITPIASRPVSDNSSVVTTTDSASGSVVKHCQHLPIPGGVALSLDLKANHEGKKRMRESISDDDEDDDDESCDFHSGGPNAKKEEIKKFENLRRRFSAKVTSKKKLLV